MLKSIIRTLLQKFIDDIDSDNCNITMEQQSKIISVLSNIANPDYRMSKVQACDYLGVSRATFDNYVRDGFIPKGIKQEGFKELSWQKSDLDIFLVNVTTTEVQFDFNNHRNIGTPFRGLLIVRLNQAIPTGTTTTLPVVFTSSGGNPQRLTGFNGADITVAQISGTGIYLCWFEHTTNTLQLLTGVV